VNGYTGSFATIKIPTRALPAQFVILSEQPQSESAAGITVNSSFASTDYTNNEYEVVDSRILIVELGEQSKPKSKVSKSSGPSAASASSAPNKKISLRLPTDSVCSPPKHSMAGMHGNEGYSGLAMSPTSKFLWSMDIHRDFIVRIICPRAVVPSLQSNMGTAPKKDERPNHTGMAYICTKLGIVYLVHVVSGVILASVNVFAGSVYERGSVIFAVCEQMPPTDLIKQHQQNYSCLFQEGAENIHTYTHTPHRSTSGIRLLANYGDLINVNANLEAVVNHCLHTLQNIDVAFDLITSSHIVSPTASILTSFMHFLAGKNGLLGGFLPVSVMLCSE
jgi:hypothetical protein